ncbi:MAG: putative Ig domain-containing protein [Ardenticatenaceae bacterium]|nr:putative Ig domain-containing protein [Ardenticatenaceae bacterium]
MPRKRKLTATLFSIFVLAFLTAQSVLAATYTLNETLPPDPVDLITPTPDWNFEGNINELRIGSVENLGDLNGDGFNDIGLGVRNHNGGLGGVFVFYGSNTGPAPVPDIIIEGDQAGAHFASYLHEGGDFNGDGYDDLIVGAQRYDNGESNEGRVYVYYGSPTGVSNTPGWFVESNQANSQFGSRVASAGDVNNDGYDDVVVGAQFYENGESGEGAAFLYLGSASGLQTTPAWTTEGNQVGARYGVDVGRTGDVNADGYDDFWVTAWWYDNGQVDEGRAYVYYGSPAGPSTTPSWTYESNENNGWLGFGGNAGDVNDDGFDDVVFSQHRFSASTFQNGNFMVFHGSASGLPATPNWEINHISEGQNISGPAYGGDVNGDGYSDLVTGSRYYTDGEFNEGAMVVYPGSSTGLTFTPLLIALSNQELGYLGNDVAYAGDVNGDGVGDMLAVATQFDNGEANEGVAILYYGSAAFEITNTSPLQTGIIGDSYSASLTASGGNAPYTWSITSGSLPPGLNLNLSTGIISGTPTAIGSYSFSIRATDSDGKAVVKDFEMDIIYPPLDIITSSPLPSGTIGVPYSTIIEATGGVPPYSWSVISGALPTGLSLNSATGEISGTPTTAGTFAFTIQVMDSAGQTDSGPFAVEPPPSNGTAGTGYSQPISVIGEGGSGGGGGESTCNNYEVVSGTLPAGLTLDPTTGIVSGTPTDGGIYDFTVACVITSGPNTGQTATKQFTITINNPEPTLDALSPGSGIAGDPETTVTLYGTNFVQSSVARWNGSDRPTTYLSSTELQMTVSAADLADVGSGTITVFNPEPTGGTSNALTFDILPPNLPPDAVDDEITTPEDTAVDIDVLANDTDPDNDVLTITSFTQPANGDLALQPNGTFVYTPTLNFHGSDSFTYTVEDAFAETDTAAVDITVTPVNDLPEVAVDTAVVTVSEGQTAANSGTLSDVDGDTLTVSASIGTAVNHGSGSWSWSFASDDGPAESQTVVITIDDGNGGQATVTFALTVENEAPTAVFSAPLTVNEGDSFAIDLDQPADPSQADTQAGFEVAFDCGSGFGPFSAAASATCQTADDEVRTVAAQIRDKDGGVSTYSQVVTVLNVAPTVTVGNDQLLILGELLTASAAFSDPGADSWTAQVDFGDGSSPQPVTIDGNSLTFNHLYAAAGEYTMTITVTDDDGGTGSSSFVVVVQTPATAVEDLIDVVGQLDPPVNGLDSKLNSALDNLNDGNPNNDHAAVNNLEAFISHVEAQRGKKITDEEADNLIAAAQRLIDVLSAP